MEEVKRVNKKEYNYLSLEEKPVEELKKLCPINEFRVVGLEELKNLKILPELLVNKYDSAVIMASGARLADNTETKNGEAREVPLNSIVIDILEQTPRYGKYVFSNPDGNSILSFRNGFKAALKRAGIENFRPHDLRHDFITTAKEAGLDTEAIMSITGHKSWYMHKRYDHPSMERKRRVVEVMAKKNGYKMDTEGFLVSEQFVVTY